MNLLESIGGDFAPPDESAPPEPQPEPEPEPEGPGDGGFYPGGIW